MIQFFSRFKKQEQPQEQPQQTTPKTVSVMMQNGSIEEYPEAFVITDGENCVVCNSKLYHTNFDCHFLQTERAGGDQVKAMNIHDAERQGFSYCYDCKKSNELLEEYK